MNNLGETLQKLEISPIAPLKWASHLNINIVEAKISYANAMAIKQAKHNFNESFINDSANKCKAAWQVINSACNTSNYKGNLSTNDVRTP